MSSLETKANHRACIFDIYFATIDWTWNLAKIRGANFGKLFSRIIYQVRVMVCFLFLLILSTHYIYNDV